MFKAMSRLEKFLPVFSKNTKIVANGHAQNVYALAEGPFDCIKLIASPRSVADTWTAGNLIKVTRSIQKSEQPNAWQEQGRRTRTSLRSRGGM